MEVFQGQFTWSIWHHKWKFSIFAVPCRWLFGRLSISAWEPQEGSVQDMCGLLLRTVGFFFFFQLKMDKL